VKWRPAGFAAGRFRGPCNPPTELAHSHPFVHDNSALPSQCNGSPPHPHAQPYRMQPALFRASDL